MEDKLQGFKYFHQRSLKYFRNSLNYAIQLAINITDIHCLKHESHYEYTVASPDIIAGNKEEYFSI